MKKSLKNVRFAQRYPKFSLPLIQYSFKSGKGMPGSGSQEWLSKLASKTEQNWKSILSLYLKVRSFSKAKDVTNKAKQLETQKWKGLRKTVKQK